MDLQTWADVLAALETVARYAVVALGTLAMAGIVVWAFLSAVSYAERQSRR